MRITIETGTKSPTETTYQGEVLGHEDAEGEGELRKRLQVLAVAAGTLLVAFVKARYLLSAKKRKKDR